MSRAGFEERSVFSRCHGSAAGAVMEVTFGNENSPSDIASIAGTNSVQVTRRHLPANRTHGYLRFQKEVLALAVLLTRQTLHETRAKHSPGLRGPPSRGGCWIQIAGSSQFSMVRAWLLAGDGRAVSRRRRA